MFLWQRLGYSLTIIRSEGDFRDALLALEKSNKEAIAFDSETTGLNIVKDLPFLIGFGFDKNIYVFEPNETFMSHFYDIASYFKYCLAHNAKFDFHMVSNFGTTVPENVNIADTIALGRLTDYVDSDGSLSLEALGTKLVHEEAKQGKKMISEHLKILRAARLKAIKNYLKEGESGITYTYYSTIKSKKVNYIPTELDSIIDEIDSLFPEINYQDSYKDKPHLMINYLADDVLLVLEVYNSLIKILDVIDKDRNTWHRENKLIRVVGDFERKGMKPDINYIISAREEIIKYRDILYRGLHKHTKEQWSSGQHKKIAQYYANRHGIMLSSTDVDSLESVLKSPKTDKLAKKVTKIILELRTIDKWLSTYVEGMLNRVYNGRIYSEINNSGTNTGRVSGDMQQQPKSPLKSRRGRELFHPRKIFINDEDFTNFYIDFSNMELRVQAYYTLLTSEGDFAMCRAFMPFKCTNIITGEMYDPLLDKKDWDNEMWVDENGDPWEALDLHSETTKKAFPEISPENPKFKSYYRDLGKRANFTKNYGGGKRALIENLGVDEETASKLNKGYYDAFPKVLEYQSWVDKQIRTYGFVENLFGRRYYFQDTSYSYRGYNYLIQGSCADYVKLKEIELYEALKPYESRMVMPIHDEIVFSIKNGEEHLILKIKEILEDAEAMMPLVPMVSDVSYTKTNWADKKAYKEVL